MPYKDKQKRYEAIKKSRAKKPEKYNALARNNQRKPSAQSRVLKRRYGITSDDWVVMINRQNGSCKICGKCPPPTKIGRSGLHVDHNHETGKVRGLLCARCNCFVGYLEKTDGISLIAKAITYLEENT